MVFESINGESMIYRRGQLVRHPAKKEWGDGVVLKSTSQNSVKVFFENGGQRNISFDFKLNKIKKEKKHSYLLLNRLQSDKEVSKKFAGFNKAVEFFYSVFPKGFYEDQYLEKERTYKLEAHKLAVEYLNQQNFSEYLEKGAYQELSDIFLKLINKTNLIFPQEKIKIKKALQDEKFAELYSKSLYELLHSDDENRDYESRFTAYTDLLKRYEADKWTIATYFQFLLYIDNAMFIKPAILKSTSELCGYEINYSPELNYLTYKLVIDFSNYLKLQLTEYGLEPRDMIDVQSFIWVITRYK